MVDRKIKTGMGNGMTKYGRALAAAKRDAKEFFCRRCILSGAVNPDACHIFDAGRWGAFNSHLIQNGILKHNLVPLKRSYHRKIDTEDFKKNPLKKVEFILDMIIDKGDKYRFSFWIDPLLDAAAEFAENNNGQLKWRHGNASRR